MDKRNLNPKAKVRCDRDGFKGYVLLETRFNKGKSCRGWLGELGDRKNQCCIICFNLKGKHTVLKPTEGGLCTKGELEYKVYALYHARAYQLLKNYASINSKTSKGSLKPHSEHK